LCTCIILCACAVRECLGAGASSLRPAQFRRAPSSAPSGLGSRNGPGLGVGLATGGSGAGCSGDKVKGAEECKDGSTTAAAGGAAGAASDAAAAAASGQPHEPPKHPKKICTPRSLVAAIIMSAMVLVRLRLPLTVALASL